MEKVNAGKLSRGDHILIEGETVKVLNMWFYGNRVQLEVEWNDKSTCQISKRTSQKVETP